MKTAIRLVVLMLGLAATYVALAADGGPIPVCNPKTGPSPTCGGK